MPDGKTYKEWVTPDESVLTPAEGLELVTDEVAYVVKKHGENRPEALYAKNLEV